MSPDAQTSPGGGAPSEIQIPPLLPVLALHEGVIFPMSVAPVVVQEDHVILVTTLVASPL